MNDDDIKPGEQLTLAQINRLRKQAHVQAVTANGSGQASAEGSGGGTETDPLKMKVPDLKAWLTEKGITFDANAKKEELQALVPKE